METLDILRLVGAVVIGYAVLFFLMWIFGRKNHSEQKKK